MAWAVELEPVPAMMTMSSGAASFALRNMVSFSLSDRVGDSPVVPLRTQAEMWASACR